MTAPLARPAHWDDPDPVPGFALQQRRFDVGVGDVWEAVAADGGPVLVRLVDLPDDGVGRAKAGRLAEALPMLAHPDLDLVRRVVPTLDGLALVRAPAGKGTTSLSALLARRRSITPAEIAGLADRLGRVLGYLHDNGVTHGRLSAGDVLLRSNGRAVLTGFGVAGIQGAGGLPADDITALAELLVSALSTVGGAQGEAISAVLNAAAGGGLDGHGFADEVLRYSDPAPMRMRPSPGRSVTELSSTASSARRSLPHAGPQRVTATSVDATSVHVGCSAGIGAANLSVPPPPVESLDAAVRALRAGARRSAARHRGQPSRRATASLPQRPAGQRPSRASRRKSRASGWAWRVAPAAAILLATVALGWRFVGPAATADDRSSSASTRASTPDIATIARLDAARAAAFAAGGTDRLTQADAPGSPALAADVDAMSIMLSHQGRARGLAPRLLSVSLLSRTGNGAVVRVVDELPPYDFVTPAGQIIARSQGHPRQVHEVRLTLISGQWRYESVLKPGAPAPPAGGAS